MENNDLNITNQKNNLGISSNIKELSIGDKVYTSDFTFDGQKEYFDTKTFVIDKINKSHINDNDVFYYEMHDEKFPKVAIKSDLKTGYFISEKEAQQAFVEMIKEIAQKAENIFNKNFPSE